MHVCLPFVLSASLVGQEDEELEKAHYTRVYKFIDTQNRLMVGRGWGKGMGTHCWEKRLFWG
jgi:hypothetical protein